MGEQLTGVIDTVYTEPLGSSLAADATTGDGFILVDDTSDFDDVAGGTFDLNGAQYAYAGVDADTGTITLDGVTLSADADAGDPVHLWDVLNGERAEELRCRVALPGTRAGDDLIDAALDDGLALTLDEGIRGYGEGESVRLELDAAGEWTAHGAKRQKPKVTSSGGGQNVVTGDSSGTDSISITSTAAGAGSSAAVDVDAIALGHQAAATAARATALGSSAQANGDRSVAVGPEPFAGGDGSVAIGDQAYCPPPATEATAVGKFSQASGDQSLGLGYGGVATGANAVSLLGRADGDGAASMGRDSRAYGLNSTAIGFNAQADASASDYGTALGAGAFVSADGGVAIGADHTGAAAAAAGTDDFVLGTGSHKVSVPGDFGVHGATPVGQSATPTTLADVIAILQAHGFCA